MNNVYLRGITGLIGLVWFSLSKWMARFGPVRRPVFEDWFDRSPNRSRSKSSSSGLLASTGRKLDIVQQGMQFLPNNIYLHVASCLDGLPFDFFHSLRQCRSLRPGIPDYVDRGGRKDPYIHSLEWNPIEIDRGR